MIVYGGLNKVHAKAIDKEIQLNGASNEATWHRALGTDWADWDGDGHADWQAD